MRILSMFQTEINSAKTCLHQKLTKVTNSESCDHDEGLLFHRVDSRRAFHDGFDSRNGQN